jgi:hypothetical protein
VGAVEAHRAPLGPFPCAQAGVEGGRAALPAPPAQPSKQAQQLSRPPPQPPPRLLPQAEPPRQQLPPGLLPRLHLQPALPRVQAERSLPQPASAAALDEMPATSQAAAAPTSGPPGTSPARHAAAQAGKRAVWDGEPPPKRPRHSIGVEEAPRPLPRLRLPPGLQAHLARVWGAADGLALGAAGVGLGLGVGGGLRGANSERGMRAALARGLHRLDTRAGEGDCLLLAGELPAARAGLLHAGLARAVQLERQAAEQQAAAAGGEGQEGQQEQLRARALRLRVQVADVMCGGELAGNAAGAAARPGQQGSGHPGQQQAPAHPCAAPVAERPVQHRSGAAVCGGGGPPGQQRGPSPVAGGPPGQAPSQTQPQDPGQH